MTRTNTTATTMTLAVVGSRSYSFDVTPFVRGITFRAIGDIAKHVDSVRLISGGARGIDALAEEYAREHGLDIEVIKPDWERYGKRAGYLRNEEIIAKANQVLAIWNGRSAGTKHDIDIAIAQRKPLHIYFIPETAEDLQ